MKSAGLRASPFILFFVPVLCGAGGGAVSPRLLLLRKGRAGGQREGEVMWDEAAWSPVATVTQGKAVPVPNKILLTRDDCCSRKQPKPPADPGADLF